MGGSGASGVLRKNASKASGGKAVVGGGSGNKVTGSFPGSMIIVPHVTGAIKGIGVDGNINIDSMNKTTAAATGGVRNESAVDRELSGGGGGRLPQPWLKGNFMSMVTEWEMLCAMKEKIDGVGNEAVDTVRSHLTDEYWEITCAVAKVVQLVRGILGVRERWCLLLDALMTMINVASAMRDRLTEIVVLIE